VSERYPDSFFRLTDRCRRALIARYGESLDLRREFTCARAWLRDVHTTGRPYRSFARFFWNWCRREMEFRERRRQQQMARPQRVSGGWIVTASSEQEALEQRERLRLWR